MPQERRCRPESLPLTSEEGRLYGQTTPFRVTGPLLGFPGRSGKKVHEFHRRPDWDELVD